MKSINLKQNNTRSIDLYLDKHERKKSQSNESLKGAFCKMHTWSPVSKTVETIVTVIVVKLLPKT